jgi:protein tyrosine phosphatase (PTP) superfamily phosphohydrolase (DUF442 family)/cytochrome c556
MQKLVAGFAVCLVISACSSTAARGTASPAPAAPAAPLAQAHPAGVTVPTANSGSPAPATAAATANAVHAQATEFPPESADAPVDLPGLKNVVTYGDGFYCGAAPDGAKGFATLARLGIKTVISVDGMQPDVADAKAQGLRYVHLPIGYNGMDETRTLEIAKAVRDLPGPIYIHCHHGMHRSAAAAAASMVTLGRLNVDQATGKMHVSGTAPAYPGLFACVQVAKPESGKLDAMPADFPETSRTSDLVNTMVSVDDAFDHLKACQKAGWKAPADHPDLVPAAEAGQVADYLRSAVALKQSQDKPAEFAAWLNQGYDRANALEQALAAGKSADDIAPLYTALGKSCTECHTKYRN